MYVLNAVQIRLIRQTFRVIANRPLEFTTLFYDKFFEIKPSLRQLFTGDLTVHGSKFIRMIAILVSLAGNPKEFVDQAKYFGKHHAALGLKEVDYDYAEIALLWALEKQLGPLWTPSTHEAWHRLHQNIAEIANQAREEAIKANL